MKKREQYQWRTKTDRWTARAALAASAIGLAGFLTSLTGTSQTFDAHNQSRVAAATCLYGTQMRDVGACGVEDASGLAEDTADAPANRASEGVATIESNGLSLESLALLFGGIGAYALKRRQNNNELRTVRDETTNEFKGIIDVSFARDDPAMRSYSLPWPDENN